MAANNLTNASGTGLSGNQNLPLQSTGSAVSSNVNQPELGNSSAMVTNTANGTGTALNSNLPKPVAQLFERAHNLFGAHKIAIMVGLAALVAVIIVTGLWSRREATPYQIIFGGLSEADTAQIMEALQKNNIPHRIDPLTGALTVPANEVHAARIKLAGLGLPKTPPVGGFEILDNQSPFGTSQFMEGARYQRALEGELAHSILTLSAVQSARVHLAIPRPSVFVRDREKPSASVVLQIQPGRYLDRNQVEAIVHLVAASVPQLEPSRVTVVDQTGELLSRQDSVVREMDLTKAQFDHMRRVEDSYVKRIEHMLTPLTGINGIRAQVTVDMDFSNTEQTREIYNPDQPSLRSEQTVEEQSRGPNEMGIPGALSNQPPAAGTVPESLNSGSTPPDAGKGVTAIQSAQSGGQQGGLVTNKRHATRNYEVDRTISHTRGSVGQIRRISAAVVVDDGFRPKVNPPQKIPRSPEEMERIRTLVREAIGYDAQRGDAISVVNLTFMPDFQKEQLYVDEDPPPWWTKPWAIELIRQVVISILILILILGVVRPIVRHVIGEEEIDEQILAIEKPKSLEALEAAGETALATREGTATQAQLTAENKNGEHGESTEDDEDIELSEDDTRELRPAGEGAEEFLPEDQIKLSADQAKLGLPQPEVGSELGLPPPENNEDVLEIPKWMLGPRHDYDKSLDHIKYIIQEEPKMVSEVLREWILADNPQERNQKK